MLSCILSHTQYPLIRMVRNDDDSDDDDDDDDFEVGDIKDDGRNNEHHN